MLQSPFRLPYFVRESTLNCGAPGTDSVMMADRLGGGEQGKLTDSTAARSLERFGLEPTKENIDKVMALYKYNRNEA